MTNYSERLLDELRAVGLDPHGLNNGEPVGDWAGSLDLVTDVLAIHVPVQADYLATDLEAHAAELRTLLGSGSPGWSAYLKVQTDLIRQLRRLDYVGKGGANERFLEMASDGNTYADAVDAALAVKETTQQKYPWPGSYR